MLLDIKMFKGTETKLKVKLYHCKSVHLKTLIAIELSNYILTLVSSGQFLSFPQNPVTSPILKGSKQFQNLSLYSFKIFLVYALPPRSRSTKVSFLKCSRTPL
jgi:hypothetical protein